MYEETELERLKFEREQLSYPEHSPSPATMTALVETGSVVATGVRGLIEELHSINQALKPNGHPIVSLADKLTLSLTEASALSGLSRSFLIGAIHENKLKAAKRGRGWNIKRTDLDIYVKKL